MRALHSSLFRSAQDATSPYQVASLKELGALFEGPSQPALAHLIVKEATPLANKLELASFYLETFHQAQKMHKGQDPFLRFQDSFAAKNCDFHYLEKMVNLFEVEDLSYQDLGALFEKLQALAHVEPAGSYFAPNQAMSSDFLGQLIPAQVSVAELTELLNSGSDIKIRFALLKTRYDCDPSLIAVIGKGLNSYGETNQGIALKTLSLLYGQHLWRDNWASYKNGTGLVPPNSNFLQVDCDHFDFKTIDDTARQNIYLCELARMRHYPSLVPHLIELTDWFDLPRLFS